MASHSNPFINPTPAMKKALADIMAIIGALPEDDRYEVMLAVGKGGEFRFSIYDDNDE